MDLFSMLVMINQTIMIILINLIVELPISNISLMPSVLMMKLLDTEIVLMIGVLKSVVNQLVIKLPSSLKLIGEVLPSLLMNNLIALNSNQLPFVFHHINKLRFSICANSKDNLLSLLKMLLI
jgi:hypothetical protein